MRKIKELFQIILNQIRNPRWFFRLTKRNAGIIVGGLMIVFLSAYLFRDKIPFFSATGADPVAYWKFDEGQGNTVYDTMGANDGTLGSGSSAPTWMSDDQCISGKCLRFDGSNDYVDMGNHTENQTTYTVEAWIKSTSTSSGSILHRGNSDNCFYNPDIRFSSSGTSLEVAESGCSGSGVIDNYAINPNTWYHVAVVRSSSTVNVYLNGLFKSTDTSQPSPGSISNAKITAGSSSTSSSFTGFSTGFIDDVKVYNYARTADQIKADYAARGTTKGVAARFGDTDLSRKLSSGLVGYWKMDEVGVSGANWTALDSSGNNNNGTGAGNASVATTAPGKFGNGGSFDGTGDYVSTSAHLLSNLNAVTVCFWAKPTATNKRMEVNEGTDSATRSGYGLAEDGNAYVLPTTSGYGYTNWSSFGVSSFIHYCGVFDGSQSTNASRAKIYLNGEIKNLNFQGTISSSVGSFTGNTAIGIRPGGEISTGLIDDIRIYNRALDPSEVKALYEYAPGPVGWWKMDEGSGSVAYDSGQGQNDGNLGTGNSAPTWTTGKFGKGLKYDGVNDYIAVTDPGTNSILDFSAGQTITLEAWIKPQVIATDTFYTILVKGPDGTNVNYYLLYGNSSSKNIFEFCYTDSGSHYNCWDSTNSIIQTNVWQHVAISYQFGDKTTFIGYYNGVSTGGAFGVADGNYAPDVANGALWIGADTYPEVVKGSIDDVKIYNYARTPEQIVSDMNAGHPAVGTPVGSTVLHLKMDEGYGSTVQDWSPQGNDGAFGAGDSAPTWTNDGKFGKALSFDGTNDYLYVTDAASLDLTSNGSLSGWVNKTANANQVLFAKGTNTFNCAAWSYGMWFYSDGRLGGCSGNNSTFLATTSGLSSNQWYHVVYTWTSSADLLYVNGNQVAIGSGGTAAATSENFFIGALGNGGSPFKGSIDEVKIYPFALTADQVKTDYAGGKTQVLGSRSTGLGGTAPDNSASRAYCVPGDASTCSAPVGEWKLDQSIGSSAPDTSTNGNTGNLGAGSSAPKWVAGKFGNALKFDGVDDYVSTTTITHNIGTGDFTWSAWIKLNSLNGSPSGDTIFSNGSYSPWFGIANTTGRVVIYWAGANTFTNSITAGSWNYVVLKRQGSTISSYINGVLDPTTFTIATSMANAVGYMGTSGSSITQDLTNGLVDQVRIYNYARTPAQIAWEYNKGAPVAYYKLNECTGTTANDWAPNANGGVNGNSGIISIGSTGTQTSAGTCTSGDTAHAWNNGATGKYSGSLNFDGSDDYVTVAANSLFDFVENNDFSISAWVKPVNISANHAIFVKKIGNGAGSAGYMTFINNQGKIATYISDGTDQVNKFSKDLVSAGSWFHIVMVYKDDTSVTMYINGNDAGGTISGTIANVDDVVNASPFAIGAESDRDMPMEGQIDEIKVFNYALTQKQIQTDYASGAVRFQ